VENNAYKVRIVFMKGGAAVCDQTFRCIVDRSPQGAITKAFRKSRIRIGSNGDGHKTYGCQKMSVEVSCLGSVEK